MNAVVLAGGPADAVARTQPGIANKAFLNVAGQTLVSRSIRALKGAKRIEYVRVVAPSGARDDRALAEADDVRDDGTKIKDSLRSGLAGMADADMLLIAASDMPVLTSEAVDDFIARALDTDADLAYGCVEKRTHDAAFPEVPHTWAHLDDGIYCGGGLAAIKPRVYPKLEGFIERLGAARKHPLRLASLFGWDVMARFALRRLSIRNAEDRASQLLGAPVCAVVSPYAETAVNVDRVSDIALAERLISARASANV